MTEHMNPQLTDDDVAALPLHHGRAELLEEIMSSPVIDRTPVRRPRPRRAAAWVTPLAAAAAVAALASIPLWAGSAPQPQPAGPAAQSSPDPGNYLVLDAPGWKVTSVTSGTDGGEVSYASGDASFEVTRYPAALYRDYVQDREHIVEPPAPGEPVDVVGLPGQMWAYNQHDRTVIREVQDGSWLELRGQGLSRSDLLDLLPRLRLVGLDEFEATLPDRFVTTDERSAVIADMADGIAAALGPARGLSPFGTPEPTFDSTQPSRYMLGEHVAGTVACGWLDSYAAGRLAGDDDQTSEAAAALATSRQWPILREMDAEGDYPDVVWEYADDAVAGRDVTGYERGLGCG